MAFELPPLPYPTDALAPHMSARTLEFHHGKHHAAYVSNLNKLIEGSPLANQSLEDIIRTTAKDKTKVTVFNNAAQAWNHAFFWRCMTPKGGGKPDGDLLSRLEQRFGGFDTFLKEFASAAETQFGSGWAWLIIDRGKLKIITTANADTPVAHGQIPVLACDVWEHAYYLDYQNRRPDFVRAFLDHLVNWDFAAQNLAHLGREKAA